MVAVPLTGGAYTAQSLIANAQRCVNLYPERNDEGDQAPFPTTHYLTPGLTERAQGIVAPVRGVFTASNNDLFAVIGNRCYYVSPGWALTLLGTLTTSDGSPYTQTNPVSMNDNGTTLLLVDGSDQGYTIDLGTRAFAIYVDAAFTANGGADKVAFLATFLIFNRPGTRQFYITLSDSTVIDPTDIAEKITNPDLLQTVQVLHRELWLIGQRTSEIWFNSGDNFPFSEQPGAYGEHGTVAKYSVAQSDVSIFLLGSDNQGQGIVFRGSAYKMLRISNHAIEAALQKYPRIDDAIGFCYQQNGHVFYVLTFPTADKTWVYDDATKLWHERVWVDNDGNEHRIRANCCAAAYGKIVVGDWANGKLYTWDLDVYTDAGQPIIRRRGFPHMVGLGKQVNYQNFIADMEVGTDENNTSVLQLQVTLRWSDTRGKTWGNGMTQTLGAGGNYQAQLKWWRLGRARDRVFELIWSAPVKTALNGAYVDSKVMGS